MSKSKFVPMLGLISTSLCASTSCRDVVDAFVGVEPRPGSLLVLAAVDEPEFPSTYVRYLDGADAAEHFAFSDGVQFATFLLPPEIYLDVAGAPRTRAFLEGIRVRRTTDDFQAEVPGNQAQATCGRCLAPVAPGREEPQILFDGDSCSPPPSSRANLWAQGSDGYVRVDDDNAVAAIQRSLRLDAPGRCACVPSLAPRIEDLKLRDFSAPRLVHFVTLRDGSVLGAGPRQVFWFDPSSGRTATYDLTKAGTGDSLTFASISLAPLSAPSNYSAILHAVSDLNPRLPNLFRIDVHDGQLNVEPIASFQEESVIRGFVQVTYDGSALVFALGHRRQAFLGGSPAAAIPVPLRGVSPSQPSIDSSGACDKAKTLRGSVRWKEHWIVWGEDALFFMEPDASRLRCLPRRLQNGSLEPVLGPYGPTQTRLHEVHQGLVAENRLFLCATIRDDSNDDHATVLSFELSVSPGGGVQIDEGRILQSLEQRSNCTDFAWVSEGGGSGGDSKGGELRVGFRNELHFLSESATVAARMALLGGYFGDDKEAISIQSLGDQRDVVTFSDGSVALASRDGLSVMRGPAPWAAGLRPFVPVQHGERVFLFGREVYELDFSAEFSSSALEASPTLRRVGELFQADQVSVAGAAVDPASTEARVETLLFGTRGLSKERERFLVKFIIKESGAPETISLLPAGTPSFTRIAALGPDRFILLDATSGHALLEQGVLTSFELPVDDPWTRQIESEEQLAFRFRRLWAKNNTAWFVGAEGYIARLAGSTWIRRVPTFLDPVRDQDVATAVFSAIQGDCPDNALFAGDIRNGSKKNIVVGRVEVEQGRAASDESLRVRLFDILGPDPDDDNFGAPIAVLAAADREAVLLDGGGLYPRPSEPTFASRPILRVPFPPRYVVTTRWNRTLVFGTAGELALIYTD